MPESVPDLIVSEDQLDEVMTRPSAALVAFIRTLSGPLVVLGAGGKMGPTLAVLARRAAEIANHPLDVIAVSRFSDSLARDWLESRGVQTRSCDLMNRHAVAALPDASNVIYLVGLKFGTSGSPSTTWAVNTLVPALISERYPAARIAALSSGNVYPLVEIGGPRSKESDPLTPLGEYANSCVARERVFEHFSRVNGTPMTLVRLSYAVDLRYGVLYDIACAIYEGRPVDMTMGCLNCIWQGDANDSIIRALDLASSPALPVNLTGIEPLPIRGLAERLAKLLDKPLLVTGNEAGSAFLSDTAQMVARLGAPPTDLDSVLRWTARWVSTGGRSLNKPTHFEVRDGKY